MKKLLRAIALMALLALFATTVWAAEAAGQASPWYDFWGKTVNLAVLVGLIWYFASKPVRKALRGMAQGLRDTVDVRRQEAKRSGLEMAEQKDQIIKLKGELDRMLTEARQDGENERVRLTEEAHQWAVHLKSQTEVQVAQEIRKIRQELRAELAEHAVQLAEQMIRERLTPDHQKRLVAAFIDQLGAQQ